VYRDDNHKPEMACALTPFDAMCGFRPPGDIAANVKATPELRALMTPPLAAELVAAAEAASAAPHDGALQATFKAALKAAYGALMRADVGAVMEQATALDMRLGASMGKSTDPMSADAVAMRLGLQYPNDVGVFSPYLLNTVRLAPGQAVFLAANEPHAYLAGTCV